MVYLLKENRNLVGIEVTLFDVPGALESIVSVIKEYELNIHYLETCFWKECRLFMAIDFTDTKVSPKDLISKFIKNRKYVADATISPIFKNIIFPSKLCAKDLGGIKAILCAYATMKGVIDGIKEELGEEAGNTFLYHLGYRIGKEIYDIYAKSLEIQDFDESMMLLKALGRGVGLGEIIDYKKKENEIVVKFEELFECEMQKGSVDKPASHLIKGLLAGFFKEFLGKDLKIEETKCIALGDPYCQFEISIVS